MKLRKIAALVLALVMLLSLGACGKKNSLEGTTIKVGASPAPHAEILEIAKEILAEQGITLEIIQFTDYVQPNTATEDGSLDANYFQHVKYLGEENEKNGWHLVSVAEIHYEPMGIYPGKTASIDALADGAQIAVPNDVTNEARALLLLEAEGLIKLREGVGLTATKLDIIENPKNLDIVEMEAAQLPNALQDVDMAVINGNYAIDAGLSVGRDAIVVEDSESDVIKTYYVNALVVKEGNENNDAILALIDALKSDAVRDYINNTYDGSVIPMF